MRQVGERKDRRHVFRGKESLSVSEQPRRKICGSLLHVQLEKMRRNIQINKGGSIYTRTLQILAYTDDVNLIGRSTGWLNDAVVQMEEEDNEVGLRINEEKTKCMINTRNKVRFRNEKHLQVYKYEFEGWGSSST